MSIKKLQLSFLLVFVMGLGIYHQPDRTYYATQKNFIPHFNISQYSSRGPVDRIIHVEFKTSSVHKVGFSSGLSEVTAFVSMPFDFSGPLHYKWTLGQNVSVIDGTLEGDLANGIKKDTTQKVKLIVQGFDQTELRHIGFEISADKNGRRLYAEGLISSQKENSFEDIVQHVEKMKAEKAGIRK